MNSADDELRFSKTFYRGAAVASLLSAVTTLGLIFLPRLYPPVPDFDARMALDGEPAYVLRSWIYLFHPFIVFAAALGVAAWCRRRAAGAASLGLAGFALWAGTEAAQQALTKVALDRTWRAAWPNADAAMREVIRNQVALYDVLWDAMYLLILLGFFTGSLFLGVAVRTAGRGAMRGTRLAPWVAGAFWAGGGLTLLMLLTEFGGPAVPWTEWLYPLIQPAGRTLIGVWLWQEAGVESAAATRSPASAV